MLLALLTLIGSIINNIDIMYFSDMCAKFMSKDCHYNANTDFIYRQKLSKLESVFFSAPALVGGSI